MNRRIKEQKLSIANICKNPLVTSACQSMRSSGGCTICTAGLTQRRRERNRTSSRPGRALQCPHPSGSGGHVAGSGTLPISRDSSAPFWRDLDRAFRGVIGPAAVGGDEIAQTRRSAMKRFPCLVLDANVIILLFRVPPVGCGRRTLRTDSLGDRRRGGRLLHRRCGY